ncbi:hypothetical protein IC619_016015 [Hazenella sp. IB182353]|uniref:spore germination lipoprotein GerD n=1 Tax=Polycladospora coralii TaxID=2771432 RepID=UPI001747247D|nr:spore germination lipoprotein GerD [Polycladospora coralii]MBS7531958.1 hypothetical protein [Polycladospora coralii]
MIRFPIGIICLLSIFTLTSCMGQSSQDQEPDYKKTKEMTLDVLQTSEGKKALQALFTDPEFKEQLMLTDETLTKAMAKTIKEPETQKEWMKILQNPDVAANLAQATEAQQKELMKTLMKDPTYQKMMIELLQDPSYTPHLLQILKSQQSRQEIQKIMEEQLSVPSFQEKMKQLMKESQSGKKESSTEESESGKKGESSEGQQNEQA